MSRRWQFIEDVAVQGARWRWERLEPDGRVGRKSGTFESYGAAARNAIIHGFRPTSDQWAIESAHLVTRHARGRESTVLAKTDGAPTTPAKKPPLPSTG